MCRYSEMEVYLRNGSAEIVIRAVHHAKKETVDNVYVSRGWQNTDTGTTSPNTDPDRCLTSV